MGNTARWSASTSYKNEACACPSGGVLVKIQDKHQLAGCVTLLFLTKKEVVMTLITTGVYGGNAINWECIDEFAEEDGYSDFLEASEAADHAADCEWHDDHESCCCGCADCWEPTEVWSTNGLWSRTLTGQLEATGTLVFVYDNNDNIVQVVRSPLTWNRGECSPCYPGQADADTPGAVRCYRLPNWMVADKDLWVGDDPEYEVV